MARKPVVELRLLVPVGFNAAWLSSRGADSLFAALTSARLSVGLALPSMVGMSGMLLVAALCFGAALFGQRGSVRIASRLLLALLFLFPWLLWSSLGALP